MKRGAKLSASMTVKEFDHGYWYATELKAFAKEIGIPAAGALRKDEIEHAIKTFLRTGATPPARPRATAALTKDVERGLRLDLPIVRYTNDAETKQFLEREARRAAPGMKRRSGAMYRLNRWREAQIRNGVTLRYRDLVQEYVRLSQSPAPFAQVPHGRYINFLSNFLAGEKGATHAQARKAWAVLKTIDAPKTYAAWSAARRRKRR